MNPLAPIVATLVLAVTVPQSDRTHRHPWIVAVHAVESSSAADGPTMGDGGRSRGPLQCSRAAWIDSKVKGKYEDVDRLEYAAKVWWAYTDRYAGKDAPFADRCRAWNSGPNWRKKRHLTDKYVEKCEKEIWP